MSTSTTDFWVLFFNTSTGGGAAPAMPATADAPDAGDSQTGTVSES